MTPAELRAIRERVSLQRAMHDHDMLPVAARDRACLVDLLGRLDPEALAAALEQ